MGAYKHSEMTVSNEDKGKESKRKQKILSSEETAMN